MQKYLSLIIVSLFVCLVSGCGEQADDAPNKKTSMNSTLVTVAKVQQKAVENTERTLGTLEGLIDPTVASEVSARVIKVHVGLGEKVKKGQLIASLDARDFTMQRNEARAEVARIQAQLNNQQKVVTRNQALVDKNFISQNALDNELAQLNVLKQQLSAAKARVGSINHSSSKSKLYAPVSGVVERKLVDTGDFVRTGDAIVQIVATQKLRAHLPFPEHIGAQLKPGLPVRLKTPTSTEVVETTVRELKPKITEGNRTIDVIADVENVTGWQPGASVQGTVILSAQNAALMIPEESVVLRPAGEVVYVVRDNVAHQAVVKTGLRQNGFIELLDGLQANETIVVDGAGFLTDQAPIKIAEPQT